MLFEKFTNSIPFICHCRVCVSVSVTKGLFWVLVFLWWNINQFLKLSSFSDTSFWNAIVISSMDLPSFSILFHCSDPLYAYISLPYFAEGILWKLHCLHRATISCNNSWSNFITFYKKICELPFLLIIWSNDDDVYDASSRMKPQGFNSQTKHAIT